MNYYSNTADNRHFKPTVLTAVIRMSFLSSYLWSRAKILVIKLMASFDNTQTRNRKMYQN